jgi:hypothetical protein
VNRAFDAQESGSDYSCNRLHFLGVTARTRQGSLRVLQSLLRDWVPGGAPSRPSRIQEGQSLLSFVRQSRLSREQGLNNAASALTLPGGSLVGDNRLQNSLNVAQCLTEALSHLLAGNSIGGILEPAVIVSDDGQRAVTKVRFASQKCLGNVRHPNDRSARGFEEKAFRASSESWTFDAGIRDVSVNRDCLLSRGCRDGSG